MRQLLLARVITCNSLSKTYSITGWRLGYVHAAPEIISQARKVHDFLPVDATAPLQEAAAAGLELPDSYYDGHRSYDHSHKIAPQILSLPELT